MFPLASAIAAVGWSFIPAGLLGVQLQFLDPENRTMQLAIIAAVSGVYGFLVSFAGGKLVNWLQEVQLHVNQYPIYAHQVTNMLGCIGAGILVWYLTFHVQQEK